LTVAVSGLTVLEDMQIIRDTLGGDSTILHPNFFAFQNTIFNAFGSKKYYCLTARLGIKRYFPTCSFHKSRYRSIKAVIYKSKMSNGEGGRGSEKCQKESRII